jgi:hypothetical protein
MGALAFRAGHSRLARTSICRSLFVYSAAGLAGLAALRGLLAGFLLWVVYRVLTATAWPLKDVLAAGVVVSALTVLPSLRPQLWSLPLYALTLYLIAARPRWLPLVFVAWANLHGGWMLGLGAVTVWAACKPSVRSGVIVLACAAATLVNPYGVHLWLSLLDAVIRGWSDVSEWQPVTRLSLGGGDLVLWIVLAAVTLWGIRKLQPGRFAAVWTVLVAVAAFRERREIPFFGITAVMLIGSRFQGKEAVLPSALWDRSGTLLVGGGTAALAAAGWLFLWPNITCLPPAREGLRPEAAATQFVRQRIEAGSRILTWFDWGLYTVWQLGDHVKVSMDNRRETVYSDAVVRDHDRFYYGHDPAYPDRIEADYVWLPRRLPAVGQLQQRGWFAFFEGPRSVILAREQGPLVHGSEGRLSPCFADP